MEYISRAKMLGFVIICNLSLPRKAACRSGTIALHLLVFIILEIKKVYSCVLIE